MAGFLGYLRFSHDLTGQTRRRWSNSFHMNVDDLTEGVAVMQALWINYLRGAARERVFCYETYVTSLAGGDDIFDVRAIPTGSQRGNLTFPSSGNDAYLAKACVAVTLSVVGSRPSRKFWRPGLVENDITNGETLSSTFADTIQAAFDNAIFDLGTDLIDPDGQPLSGVGRLRLTTREFGKESTTNLPVPPPLG